MSGPAAAILGLPGPVLEGTDRAFLRAADPWGVILFARNVRDPAQLARLTADIRDTLGRDAPVLVDQEGGRVARLRGPHWTEWPSPATAAAGPATEEAIHLRHRLIAAELAAVGIDVNCAPCADLAGPATHPFLADRCYGTTVQQVVRNARAAADGLLTGGVLPVLKHLPGHGRATADSHFALPVVAAPLADLDASDLAPFAALADLPIAMTAHVVYAAVDDRPATCAPPLIALIRDRIGFRGLLVTDDLGMQALSGTAAQRTAQAIAAGCDIALHGNGDAATLRTVADAAGPLTAAAQARSDAALARRRLPDPHDARALASC
ncbi:beta-N-acetylhexosaminidase, partial [Rhodobaculum claviforme]|nr:beta-N-acetylhexosaminidase [Rhodobaculum claviforme]